MTMTPVDLMLGKCAESLALRRAFPAELAGLETTEEVAAPAYGTVDMVTGEVGGGGATPDERNALVAMARALDASQREAYAAWMAENGIPRVSHPDLTSEQALLARAYLANVDAGREPAA